MIIYCDKKTGDELLSDAYDIKEIDGVVFEADAARINISEGDVDIGANPSAEGGDEGIDSGEVKSVINIVHSFQLSESSMDKSGYKTYFKDFLKKYKDELSPEQQKAIQAYCVNKILKNFDDYEFFTGESMDPDGMLVLMNYREDGITPYFVYWKVGLKETKV